MSATFDFVAGLVRLDWHDGEQPLTSVLVSVANEAIHWRLTQDGRSYEFTCRLHGSAVNGQLARFRMGLPVQPENIRFFRVVPAPGQPNQSLTQEMGCHPPAAAWKAIGRELIRFARQLQFKLSHPPRPRPPAAPTAARPFSRQAVLPGQNHPPSVPAPAPRAKPVAARSAAPPATPPAPVPARLPVPAVPMQVEPVRFDATPPLAGLGADLADLGDYLLRERASLWWVSNQCDDLLCLPHCAIEHLEHQLRSALRVIGPMRGRALLSDEVGLGKTIEAGLVLKEYLTRGMVKRFLVLTLPSLVDQWEEELDSKFRIPVATTNHALFRSDPTTFWREHPAIVASIHTLKQDAHLAAARTAPWDLLIVDEAHYLRSRSTKTWQAINALPRQFLLLLTATPVQNSIEEIYNLVTLLQPGQLPSPKEFRNRFIDPAKPRQPRDPDELRRLLNQVMIRNTRASAGIKLPGRRAETVLFEPTAAERDFWEGWEREFRGILAGFSPSQSSLWGRLLLQAAGSSPHAWREALAKFPDQAAAGRWRDAAPLLESWGRKTAVLKPLAAAAGGVVVFSQFLATQSALAEQLRAARVTTWLINGQTPAVQRQPITEQFRDQGGVLLLTHSGTEGRNLQFCHRLVNFDLPWNPMEIEQRIGRLHRLGQQHPVEIYNLVQSGTLQAHLLEILQDKLNLFELVVGETGLVLGERFGSDDFAEEVFRRWQQSNGQVAAAMAVLGQDLQQARAAFEQVKRLDQVLFEQDYETT